MHACLQNVLVSLGNEIREAIQESIDNKSSMLEEKNGYEKDQLLEQLV